MMSKTMYACGFLLASTASGLSMSLEAAGSSSRPITKIVGLLKGMSKQLEEEGEEDQKTYDKYKCWVQVNGHDKLKLIEAAKTKVPALKAKVEYLLGKSQKLKKEVEKTEDERAANQAALDTATALRAQQKQEFDKDMSRMNQDVNAVENAKTTLSLMQEKASGAAFLQVPTGKKIAAALLEVVREHSDRMTPTHQRTLTEFLQGSSSSDSDSEGPSVGSITGVLDGMVDDFKSDIAQVVEEENKNIASYKALKEAKDGEIKAATNMIEKKKEEKAQANEERAILKQEIKDTVGTLLDEEEFAKEVVAKGEVMDKEFEERTKTRSEEMEAISKAVEVLDGDDAHELFSKTLPTFLQESEDSTRREDAIAALNRASDKDMRVKTIALQAKLDSFTRVKKAIEEMVAGLKKEMAEEVEKRDFCIESFRENEMATQEKTADKKKVVTKIATLKGKIEQSKKDIAAVEVEVTELKKQMALASQNREAENTEFQQVVKEQRQTAVLLQKAITILEGFYNKGALMQVRSHKQEPEPATFKDYKTNKKSFGVLGMIKQVMTDTKAMEAEATRAEASAQSAYEVFSKDSTKSVKDKVKDISDSKKAKAAFEKELVVAENSDEGFQADLEELKTNSDELHASCDFMVKNFDLRQTAFEEEMDSLKQAKSILNGAKY
eukprot:TRINITY_DN78963_c0_g1_i1.p1 TRINITY_DN78963_c0_g1~~TRINITY_DN78963_c0_g1_i1.p1  ORF type:complete len:667 (+),score=245.42 TRINITY_DN78963_c0_g1_i1:114-2114(+)